ncbi:hypothetical protein F5H01DRAFT_318153 [Linnemannia elongata]|nr:hypothetical protein F5H01DRAFT_318153 [Linnemannia elongata]
MVSLKLSILFAAVCILGSEAVNLYKGTKRNGQWYPFVANENECKPVRGEFVGYVNSVYVDAPWQCDMFASLSCTGPYLHLDSGDHDNFQTHYSVSMKCYTS